MKRPSLFAGMLLLSAALGAATTALAGFDSTFVETRTLPGFDTPLVSHGRMSYDATRGFRWEITAPYRYVFEMRGGQAQETLPDGTSRRLNPDETPWLAAVEHIFVGALSGNTSELERYFQVSVTPLTHGRRVMLKPKPGPIAQAIVSIEVTERGPGEPERLEIVETSGGHMQIRFGPPAKATP